MMRFIVGLVLASTCTEAFLRPSLQVAVPHGYRPSPLIVQAAKGFGKEATSTKKPPKEEANPADEETAVSVQPTPASPPQMNAGQRALEQMRRERAEQRNAELQKARGVLEQDSQAQLESAAIPERVAQRMGRRMLPFVGIPLFLGMGAFVGFWYFATYRDLSFEPSLVAASTILILVVGLLGITYSVMSTSWDTDREGSLLGADEFRKNVDNIKDGLSRSKENALLRDKMASDQGMQRALMTQQPPGGEASKTKKATSLDAKLRDELE